MTPNFGVMLGWLFAGLGALAAGIGLLRAGIAIGRSADKTVEAVLEHGDSAKRIAESNERQAQALEGTKSLVPLLESVHEDRVRINEELQGLHATLRVQSRKLNQVLNDGKTDPDA